VSFAEAFLNLPPTNNVAGQIDAAFTTRFPDPTERARVVADLIARLGLPPSLASETSLFVQNVSIVNSRSAVVSYVGPRNAVALSVFHSSNRQLPDSIFSSLVAGVEDIIQEGASLTFSHQFTSLTAGNLSLEGLRTEGRGAAVGQLSKQATVRAQITRRVAPRTTAFVGARYQDFDSDAAGVVSAAREHAAYIGLAHRF
jgi:uncharacterized protein (PEP-CTERM system associated)